MRLLHLLVSYLRVILRRSLLSIQIHCLLAKDKGDNVQVVILVLPDVVQAFDSETEAAIHASLPIFIFFVLSLDTLFALSIRERDQVFP
jgi:hypothetical protein